MEFSSWYSDGTKTKINIISSYTTAAGSWEIVVRTVGRWNDSVTISAITYSTVAGTITGRLTLYQYD